MMVERSCFKKHFFKAGRLDWVVSLVGRGKPLSSAPSGLRRGGANRGCEAGQRLANCVPECCLQIGESLKTQGYLLHVVIGDRENLPRPSTYRECHDRHLHDNAVCVEVAGGLGDLGLRGSGTHVD